MTDAKPITPPSSPTATRAEQKIGFMPVAPMKHPATTSKFSLWSLAVDCAAICCVVFLAGPHENHSAKYAPPPFLDYLNLGPPHLGGDR